MHFPHGARHSGASRVTLLTEGTYPHSHGGVSVWCDQLVTGMPDIAFDVIAVTGTGREPVVWDVPAHVGRIFSVPMWGPTPAGQHPRGHHRQRLAESYEQFVTALLDPRAEDGFGPALYALAGAAEEGRLSPFLRGDRAIGILTALWNRSGLAVREARPTLQDAVTATALLEHALRPLAGPYPEVGVAHAVSGGVAALPGLAALQRHGVPLLLTEHGVYLRERYLGYRTAPYRWPVKALVLGFFRLLAEETYRRAALITPGNHYNRLWEEHGGAAPDSIRTVYNGVDPAAFPPAGPEPSDPVLSWAGRVDPIKDLETLIRAFALVRARVPTARLRLFGGTPRGGEAYRDRCEALAAELGHAAAVTFEGRVEDIRDAYAAGNIVMLSSISEGFPFTLIEAMSCGRATVSTDVGGVREAVGDTGLVVPPRDPAAMADAALELLADAERRRSMGERARLRVIEQFTLRQTIDTFRSIYQELSESGGRRALSAVEEHAPTTVCRSPLRSAAG
ncbi:GT4 family glycosyltransferase PelF (plasmid) [Streptomyces californicus]|uniref:D-inositol 3-phosphate glycosyltransferase n=1 Tax=Streptomyces californicus TaxID=67351 RepID=A0ABD7D6I5_9ACTN|nr:GT4 family glycosyltransferase PelF [Streptomyces californicus]MDW4901649.1 GT4 family glycosyltransferase PelF [Streptomyces californicus]QRV39099.1 GT4 family glycosyltransferase PelF [Streptomyces californicus]QRV52552.1 GT4 family glycosyltransferase PelF [Streptomyces californicus]